MKVRLFKQFEGSKIFQLALAVLLLVTLAACGEEPEPNAGDPIPNVRAGLVALYSGDLEGVSTYFCEAIVLSAKRIANQAAEGEGRIEFRNSTLEVSNKQAKRNWTVALRGEYAIWLNGQAVVHDTAQEGTVYIGIKVEDDIWKICAFDTDTPTPAP